MNNNGFEIPKAICGYPLPGWRLQRVEYDPGRANNEAPGWVVSLHTETSNPCADNRRYRCVMTRSLIGPLEAWDEAIAIALHENERAQAIEARRAGTAETGSVHESAVAASDAPKGGDHA
jgi:hypothetical protein